MSELLLTVSILVSGRTETTEKCLKSVQKLLNLVPGELILVDTGCDSALRKTIETYTDKIIDFTWCNDFAKARNAGLKQASGKWFLFLDDDEWFEDVTPIAAFFNSGEYLAYDQATYYARNYADFKGVNYSDDIVSRMIKLEPDTHFEGAVHEALVPARGKCKCIHAFVHHYGYVFTSEEEKRAHFERNVKILAELQKKEPDNIRWPLQLLLEYSAQEEWEELYKVCKRTLQILENQNIPFLNQCRGAFYTGLLYSLGMTGNEEEWNKRIPEILNDERLTLSGRCAVLYRASRAGMKFEKWEQVQTFCNGYFEAYEKNMQIERSEQEEIIEQSIIFVKDAVKQDAYEEMEYLLAEAMIKQNREKEYPKAKAEDILKILRKYLEGNGEFLNLSEIFWQMGERQIIPLEEELLSLPLSQWMVQVMVLQNRKSDEEWDNKRRNLQLIRTREDIRYCYFDMNDVNEQISGSVEGKGYHQLTLLLQEFCDRNLAFAHMVYTEYAFSGEMEMLPGNCRAAVYAKHYLECEKNNWDGRLEAIRRVAKAYPGMGEFVKALAKEIGRQQEQETETAQEAGAQLRKMAGEVKKQVRQLMEQKMYAEAYQIVCQLRQMLPEDKETRQLEKQLKKKFS